MEKLLLQDDEDMPCDLVGLKTIHDFEAAAAFLVTRLLGREATVYEASIMEEALITLRINLEEKV